jgi:hypothetical protein
VKADEDFVMEANIIGENELDIAVPGDIGTNDNADDLSSKREFSILNLRTKKRLRLASYHSAPQASEVSRRASGHVQLQPSHAAASEVSTEEISTGMATYLAIGLENTKVEQMSLSRLAAAIAEFMVDYAAHRGTEWGELYVRIKKAFDAHGIAGKLLFGEISVSAQEFRNIVTGSIPKASGLVPVGYAIAISRLAQMWWRHE